MAGLIKWNRSDYAKLSRAVSDFNKKLNKLEAEERKLYLPLPVNYKELKESIKTRSALNQKINSLKRFLKEGMEDIYVTEGGEKLSKWEYKELGYLKKNASIKLRNEIKEIDRSKTPYETVDERITKGLIKNFNKLNESKGKEFREIKRRLNFYGSSDYEMKKAVIWKENLLEQAENVSNLKGYDKFIEFINSFKNPIQLYETIKERTHTLIDDYINLFAYSELQQIQFDDLLSELGIDISEWSNLETI